MLIPKEVFSLAKISNKNSKGKLPDGMYIVKKYNKINIISHMQTFAFTFAQMECANVDDCFIHIPLKDCKNIESLMKSNRESYCNIECDSSQIVCTIGQSSIRLENDIYHRYIAEKIISFVEDKKESEEEGKTVEGENQIGLNPKYVNEILSAFMAAFPDSPIVFKISGPQKPAILRPANSNLEVFAWIMPVMLNQ